MIIIIMFGAAIAMFASIMFIEVKTPQLILATLCGLLFVGATFVMTLNYSHHFGMHKVTTTTSRTIYSASNSTMPLALYQPVGTSGQDNVYIYNVKPRQRRLTTPRPMNTPPVRSSGQTKQPLNW